MLRERYQVPTAAIPIVYGGLSVEGRATQMTPQRAAQQFQAQLAGTQGHERELVVERIRYLLRVNDRDQVDAFLTALGVQPHEGLSWAERYAGVQAEVTA